MWSCYFFKLKLNKIYPISLTKISGITYAINQLLSNERLHKELLVFSVTPFKIEQKIKIKTVQQIKSRIWERKKINMQTPAKIHVTEIFLMEDMRRDLPPKFREICMETPCWPETNRNIRHWVLLQERDFISRRTHKRYNNNFFS